MLNINDNGDLINGTEDLIYENGDLIYDHSTDKWLDLNTLSIDDLEHLKLDRIDYQKFIKHFEKRGSK